MGYAVPVHIRSGEGSPLKDMTGFTDTIEIVMRVPTYRKNGVMQVIYKGERYQMHGMVRTPYFICPERRGK